MKHIIIIFAFATTSFGFTSDRPNSCQLVDELIYYTAPVVERFSNIALPNDIYSVSGMDVGHNTTLQFAVKRRGAIVVRLGPNNSDYYGTFDIYIPVKIVNTRVDWFTKEFGITVRHHEDISDSELTLKAQVKFQIKDNMFYTNLNNSFQWNRKPIITILGFPISIGTLAGEQVQKALNGVNANWKFAIDPAIKDFLKGNCEWKDALYSAYVMLYNYPLSADDQRRIRQKVREWINSEL